MWLSMGTCWLCGEAPIAPGLSFPNHIRREQMKRENFRSRLGFLLVSAGCAIGIGNVWKFPYIAGENGGGVLLPR